MFKVPDEKQNLRTHNNTPNISSATFDFPSGYSDELWAAALTICCLLALYCNGIVITSLYRQNKSLIALDILFASLAVQNCTLAVSTFPFVCISAIYHGWIFGRASE
ncbi:hypothetical protein RvY_07910 [Ramazzottius varieornatus]|uniref:G-protein coupled receptors family 1 profile domain-containing protein n=1 Tax=Ramazzottius varieornatus TaxID=947166 RepID=A0A1D1V430_RAMVA|nr:hypothetical protein RvY_07910 [Ramazzottius varieornatus]